MRKVINVKSRQNSSAEIRLVTINKLAVLSRRGRSEALSYPRLVTEEATITSELKTTKPPNTSGSYSLVIMGRLTIIMLRVNILPVSTFAVFCTNPLIYGVLAR
jgi:hypothetical protein